MASLIRPTPRQLRPEETNRLVARELIRQAVAKCNTAKMLAEERAKKIIEDYEKRRKVSDLR